jgi:exopolyphosphatase/guanosine-5'-triphosphate,3'-diphosphate pyrophosphatase
LSCACFDDGRVTEARTHEVELLVRLKLEPMTVEFQDLGWQVVTCTSSTIKAIQDAGKTRESWWGLL